MTPADQPALCPVCGEDVDGSGCSCPECPTCGTQGDPRCYVSWHGLPFRADSVQAFCEHVGIEPVESALRAIDRHNVEHVWLVMRDGRRVYYHSENAGALRAWETIRAVGVGIIAWDGSDWEWSDESLLDNENPFAALDRLREAAHDALSAYEASA